MPMPTARKTIEVRIDDADGGAWVMVRWLRTLGISGTHLFVAKDCERGDLATLLLGDVALADDILAAIRDARSSDTSP